MKLNYQFKRKITSADLFDACQPPLVFEVRTRPSRKWAKLNNDFETGGSTDVDTAKELIAMSFLTVSDGGQAYPLTTVENVDALRKAIENENPGYGDEFLCHVAWGFQANHYTYLTEHLGNSLKPLSQSNGTGLKRDPAVVS